MDWRLFSRLLPCHDLNVEVEVQWVGVIRLVDVRSFLSLVVHFLDRSFEGNLNIEALNLFMLRRLVVKNLGHSVRFIGDSEL